MTKKKEKMVLGRKIRQATGLKLPVAMSLAKYFVRFSSFADLPEPLKNHVSYRDYSCLDCYDTHFNMVLIGPKGEYRF